MKKTFTCRSIVFENGKYIHDSRKDRAERYDLSTDPGEQIDLAQKHPDRTAALRRLVEQQQARSHAWSKTAAENVVLAEQNAEMLRVLGYVDE